MLKRNSNQVKCKNYSQHLTTSNSLAFCFHALFLLIDRASRKLYLLHLFTGWSWCTFYYIFCCFHIFAFRFYFILFLPFCSYVAFPELFLDQKENMAASLSFISPFINLSPFYLMFSQNVY